MKNTIFLDNEKVEKQIYPNESASQTGDNLTVSKSDENPMSLDNIGFWEIKVSIMQNIKKIWDSLIEYLNSNDNVIGISTIPIYGSGSQFYKIKIITSDVENADIIKSVLDDLYNMKLVRKSEKVFYYTKEDYQLEQSKEDRHFKYSSTFFDSNSYKPSEE